MSAFHWTMVFAFGLLVSTPATSAVDPPVISKPRPAPNTPSTMLPLPPAVIDNQLAIGGDDIRARLVDTRLNVEVSVNGRGPYRFVVDSGADTSAVGLRIAHDLELPLAKPAILNGTTARSIVDRVKVDELVMGPSTVRNLEVPALREIDLGGDGLIGIDALVQQRLMMDFEKRIVKVEDARKPMRRYPGEIVITARRQRGQLILTAVHANRYPLDAIIDTGSEITIGNLALRDKLLRKYGDKFWEAEAIGVTGAVIKLKFAMIEELQLGPIFLQNVPIAFADLPPFKVFGLADEPALLLGTDILETFRRVALDFKSRKVRFQLRKCKEEGLIVSTSKTASITRLSTTSGDACVR